MCNRNNRNWLTRSFFVCFLATVLAYVITASFQHLGIDLKVFNPLSDVLPRTSISNNDTEESSKIVDESSLTTSILEEAGTIDAPILKETDGTEVGEETTPDIDKKTSDLVDYSSEKNALVRLREKLNHASSEPLHIAFFGDSFSEGDILVGDLRRMLQERFGGKGIGYVSVSSPTARFRTTVNHRFSGDWKSSTLLHSGTFTTSGAFDRLSGKGNVTYTMIHSTSTNSEINTVKIIYESASQSLLTTTINDSIKTSYELEPTGLGNLSVLIEEAKSINSVSLEVESEDIRIHGIYLDGYSGVTLDNMSMRGASGGELTKISGGLYSQINSVRNYDLIFIAFGLNALSTEENEDEYYWYYNKLKKSIQHLKKMCPDAIFIIFSVSDRATIADGKVVTLSGVYKVRSQQKRLAKEEGCLFWDTFSVVKSMGGIETMVKKGWAAKDYTHLSGAGGRQLARELYKSIAEESK